MKLEKINRLFAAYTTEAPASQKATQEKQIQDASAKVQEAVTVAKDFGSNNVQSDRAKFERIRDEVRNGTYKSDSREVAKSLLRDLFA